MTTANVRVRLGHFDVVHPSESQTSVYVEIPDVARAHYLLPAHFHDSLRDKEWGEVLDTAHGYLDSITWASDTATAQARADVRAWLQVDENRDALNAAWFQHRAQQDPVSRALLRDKERLLARIAELEDAAFGDATVRILAPVGQIRHLHAAVAAQMARADTLDRLCREQRERADKAEARLAELQAGTPTLYLTEYEGAEPLLYWDLKTAKALCDEDARIEIAFTSGRYGFDWIEEDGVHQQIWTDPDTDARKHDAPGRVTPLKVQPKETDASVEAPADKLTRTFAPVQALREDEARGGAGC
ncbi:hypothetical protein ACWDA7_38770 [Streptomyces sp. NPDC001156]